MGAKRSGDPLLRNPITGIVACWARAVSGHAAPDPANSFMNSRRLTCRPQSRCAHGINAHKYSERGQLNVRKWLDIPSESPDVGFRRLANIPRTLFPRREMFVI